MGSAYLLGDVGEVITADKLRNICKMSVVRTIYLPSKGKFSEIDMVAISPLGIFIIENKNYSGMVKGDYDDLYWHVRYNNYNSERLYNPIKQNEKHRILLKELLISLGFEDIPVYNTVIFNDKANLNLTNTGKNVFTLSSFVDTYNKVNLHIVDKEEQSRLYSIMRIFSDCSDEARLLHISLLKG